MQPLFQSTFLQALGFAIANSLWQTALLWLLYTLLSHVLTLSSAARYRVAVAAQLISFSWFVVTIQFYYAALLQHPAAETTSQGLQALAAGNTGFSTQLIRYLVKAEQVLPYVSTAYLLLMLFLCVRWITGYRQTRLVRTQGLQKIPVEWRLFVRRIAAQLGIKKEVRIFLSATITTPLTVGFWKPIILVPVASINNLTTAQLEAVLLHELAHVKRYDYLVNIILSAVEIALFFNPFTQLFSKSIRKERENSCDDWVLQFRYQAADYAEALLRIACLQTTPAFAMAATGKKNELLVRVKRMIGEKENRFNYRRQLLAFLLVSGVLTSVAWLNPTAQTGRNNNAGLVQQKSKKQQPIPSAAYVSIAESPTEANPLFDPSFLLSKPMQAEMKKELHAAQAELRNLNVHPDVIASIPTLVSDALEKASAELAQQRSGINFDKEIAAMEQAKLGMEKMLRDSLSAPRMFQPLFNKEFDRSLQQMQGEIEKAKTDIAATARFKKKFAAEQAKVKTDLRQAMDELKAIGLDKLAENSLQMVGQLFDKTPEQPRMRKFLPKKSEAETESPRIKQPDQPRITQEFSMPEIPVSETRREAFVFTPELIAQLSSLAALVDQMPFERMSPEMQLRVKEKLALIQKAFSKKIKVMPALNRVRIVEDSIYIRMQ